MCATWFLSERWLTKTDHNLWQFRCSEECILGFELAQKSLRDSLFRAKPQIARIFVTGTHGVEHFLCMWSWVLDHRCISNAFMNSKQKLETKATKQLGSVRLWENSQPNPSVHFSAFVFCVFFLLFVKRYFAFFVFFLGLFLGFYFLRVFCVFSSACFLLRFL